MNKQTVYITFDEAVDLQFKLMREYGDVRFGVANRNLIESALARAQNAAVYENADIIRQAATLWYGLIKNHPWKGGNWRTATFVTKLFLERNGSELTASTDELVELCAFVQSDLWKVDEIESWLRQRIA